MGIEDILFTTKDGVDIKMGDTFWYVTSDSYRVGEGVANGAIRDDVFLFSSERQAIQFSWDNKPIWSRKDFRELIKAFEEIIAPKAD